MCNEEDCLGKIKAKWKTKTKQTNIKKTKHAKHKHIDVQKGVRMLGKIEWNKKKSKIKEKKKRASKYLCQLYNN